MQKLIKIFEKAEENFYAFIILGGTILLFVNVILRYVFNSGIIWSEELVRYAIIWLTFFSIGYGVRKDTHVKIDILHYYLPKKANKALNIIVEIMSAIFCTSMARYSLDVMLQQFNSGQLTPSLQIPFYTITLSLPVGFTIAALRYLESAYRKAEEKNSDEPVSKIAEGVK